MKKHIQWLLLLTACCALLLPGCRRKPIETEAETQSETATEKITEKQTEKIEPETEPQSETQKKTSKPTTVAPNSTVPSPQTPETQTPETQTPQTQAATDAPASQQCQYCGGWFSTAIGQDGSSEYSSHVAQEEAYIASLEDYDSSEYYTGTDGNQYAQCSYCFQWFSTTPDASGYSPYSEHIAAESAYAAQSGNSEEYLQCPNCGNWVTSSEYNDHIANGW